MSVAGRAVPVVVRLLLCVSLGSLGTASAEQILQMFPGPDGLSGVQRHGTPATVGGFELSSGPDESLQWFTPPGREPVAVRLAPDAVWSTWFDTPPPIAGKLDAKGWFGVLSLDCFAEAGQQIKLRMEVTDEDAGRVVMKSTVKVTETSHRSESGSRVQRIHLRIDAKDFAAWADSVLRLDLSVEGGPVVIEQMCFERFHRETSRELLGKANGPFGPDLLQSGALGFSALTEHQGVSFPVMSVTKGSPAARAGLAVGDLITSVDGRPFPRSSLAPGEDWFEQSHEAFLGRAILAAARSDADKPQLRLTVLRAKGPRELTLKLRKPPRVATAFNEQDPELRRLYADVVQWVAEHQRGDGSWPGHGEVNTSLAALTLLGTRDPAHSGAIHRAYRYFLRHNPDPRKMKSYWIIAFQGWFIAEYYLATGDEKAKEWVARAVEWLPSTSHTCTWRMPAFGHGIDGLPYDDKGLMAPTAHLLVFDSLAARCGVEPTLLDHLSDYILHSWSDPSNGGHGAMGYNASCRDQDQHWSRSGLVALALHLRSEWPQMERSLLDNLGRRDAWMLNSHAYGEPGGALGLLGLAVAAPESYGEIQSRWAWRYANAWEPGYGLRYSTPHMGSPYMGEDEIMNPAYGLLFAALDGGLVMAGGEEKRWLQRR